ncbi:MAG: tektin family protein, partial [Brevibacterium aurantiacum]|nr:tektin family protein [Brevibacterium aurantiacum]
MALKLIGAVGVKVRPEAEDFRDETERQLKKQMGNKKGLPVDVDPEINMKQFRAEFEKARKSLQTELKRQSSTVEFTTDVRFDTDGWKDAKKHLTRMEHEIRNEMVKTKASLVDLDKQRKDSMRVARELAIEHKKLAARAMRGTASGNDVARVKDLYDLTRRSLADTETQIESLNNSLKDSQDQMLLNARDQADYTKNLGDAVKAHEDLIKGTADAHREYMAQIRKDSENLLSGLGYGIKKNVRNIRDAFESIGEIGARKLGIELDLEKFKARLQSAKRMFRSTVDDMDDSEADIKPTLDDSAQRIAWARLKWVARDRIAMIHVKVKKSSLNAARNALNAALNLSGARTGLNLIKDFGRYIRDLNQHIPALAGIGIAAVSAAGGITALVGSVAHLANEFARMAGAALAMPAILAGFAIGLGTMVAVMQDFNRELPQVGQDLNELQDIMSDNFWNQARVPIMDAWNKTFPLFAKGIQETSTALGKWSAAFADAFAVEFDAATFDKMFSNLNKSIDIATKGVDDFVRALAVLGRTGSEYLPRLAEWGNDVTKSFADWIEEAEKTGRLNDIIDTGIEKIQQFGKLIRETGEWLYIMGSAAERAGFSGFQQMADGMERFNESLKSSEGQEVLDDIFQGAAHIADGFKRALGAVTDFVWESSDMLRELGDIVGDLTGDTFERMFEAFERPKFQNGLTDLFQGVSDGIDHITDQAPIIADVLGSVGSLAGTVAENMGKVVGKLLEVFGPEISDALDDIAPDIESVGDSLSSMMDHLDNAGFDEFVGDMIRLAGSALGDLAKDLEGISIAMDAISKLGKGDFEGLKELNEEIKNMHEGKSLEEIAKEDEATPLENLPLVGGFFRWIDESVAKMVQYVADIDWSAIGDALWGGFQDVFSFEGLFVFDDWWPAIQDWWNEQIAEIVDIFNTAKEWIVEVWDGFWNWLTSLFSGSGDTDVTAPGSGGAGMQTSIFDQFNIEGWGDTLAEKLNEAREWISETWNGFTSWLSGLFGGGGGEGEGGGNSFVIDIVLNAIDYASDIITQTKNRALNFALGFYQAVLNALDTASDIVTQARNRALSFASGFYQAVLSALDTASDIIIQARNRALSFAH